MAFKMKNPSMAKMAKMAGNNRTAMKMKMESAAKMKKEAAMKLKKEAPMKKDSRSLLDKAKDEGKQLLKGAKAGLSELANKDYFRPKHAVEQAVKAYKKEEDKQAAKRKAGSKSPSKMKKSAMKLDKKEAFRRERKENPKKPGMGANKPLDPKIPKKVNSKKDLKPIKPGKSVESATKFNAKLKAASKAGKLSGKFKEAVDAAPAKMKKSAMKLKKEDVKKDLKGGREMLAAKKNPGKPKRVGTSIYSDTYQGTGDTKSTRKAEKKFAKADKKLAKGKLKQAERKVKKGRKTVVSMPSGPTTRRVMRRS